MVSNIFFAYFILISLCKDSNDFFIDNMGYGCNPGRLYDCEGNLIEEKAPWELLLEERDISVGPRRVVSIRIGTVSYI